MIHHTETTQWLQKAPNPAPPNPLLRIIRAAGKLKAAGAPIVFTPVKPPTSLAAAPAQIWKARRSAPSPIPSYWQPSTSLLSHRQQYPLLPPATSSTFPIPFPLSCLPLWTIYLRSRFPNASPEIYNIPILIRSRLPGPSNQYPTRLGLLRAAIRHPLSCRTNRSRHTSTCSPGTPRTLATFLDWVQQIALQQERHQNTIRLHALRIAIATGNHWRR